MDEFSFAALPGLNPQLETLELFMAGRLTGNNMIDIASRLKNLTKLTLCGAFLVREAHFVESLSNLTNLTHLVIEYSSRWNLATTQALVTHCPNLHTFKLHYAMRFNDDALALLPKLTKLRCLSLTKLPLLTCEAMATSIMLGMGTQLESLELKELDQCVDGTVILALATALPPQSKLTHLTLHTVPLVNDESLLALVGKVTHLTHLTLSRTILLTHETIGALVKSNPRLEHLDLNSTLHTHEQNDVDSVFNGTDEYGADVPSQLKSLDLSWSRGVNDVVLENIVKRNKALSRIHVWGCHRVSEWWCRRTSREGILEKGADGGDDEGEVGRRFINVQAGVSLIHD